MGNAKSKSNYQERFDVEIKFLNEILNEVISSNGFTHDANYKISHENLCDKFTFVLEKNLGKHQKAFIKDLNDNVIILPKENENGKINKAEICSTISRHYNRIFKIIHAIRWILDLEHDGKYSVAGICQRNIRTTEGIVEIKFCATKQYMKHMDKDGEINVKKSKKINFKHLAGFEILMKQVLDPDEAKVFKRLLESMLNKKRLNINAADKLILQNFKGFTNEIYQFDKDMKQAKHYGGGNKISDNDLLFHTSENNPVFSNDTCFEKKTFMVKSNRNIDRKIIKQKQDFIEMIGKMNQLMNEMITRNEEGRSELRVMTHEQLNNIEEQSKRLFMVFYLQSITNYNIILSTAEKMPNLKSIV
jgi:hypothetical protein